VLVDLSRFGLQSGGIKRLRRRMLQAAICNAKRADPASLVSFTGRFRPPRAARQLRARSRPPVPGLPPAQMPPYRRAGAYHCCLPLSQQKRLVLAGRSRCRTLTTEHPRQLLKRLAPQTADLKPRVGSLLSMYGSVKVM
jgi:hypothetical protein